MNESIDFKIFAQQYNTLRNYHPETFEHKVFAEHVVHKGKKIRLNDVSNFSMLHDNLNTFGSSGERSQLMLSELGKTELMQTSSNMGMTLSMGPTTIDTTKKSSLNQT